MTARVSALSAAFVLALAGAARAQIGPEPPAATLEAQALEAESAKQWEKAYTLCLRAASDYITEHNQSKSDETNKECDRIKREWTGGSSNGASSPSSGAARPLWSDFTPRAGAPSGVYRCSTMVMRLVGMSAPGGVGGMPLRVPQMMMLGTLRFTPGHYSGPTTTPGTWSASGSALHLSGKPYNTAKAEYGVNGGGHSTVRFTWPPAAEGAQPQTWMCTR